MTFPGYGQQQGGFPQQGPPAFAGQPAAQPQQGWGAPQQAQQQPPMAMQPASNPTAASGAFFGGQSGGGAGVPSFKFESLVGHAVSGIVVSATPQEVTDFTTKQVVIDDHTGQPANQLQIVLETGLRGWQGVSRIPTDDNGAPLPPSEDDGKRAIYTAGKRTDGQSWMSGAIKDAMAAAGRNPAEGLEVGAALAVSVSEVVPSNKGNPYRKYVAKYASPGTFPREAVLTPVQGAAPPPAQQAPQQQAPQQQAPQQQAPQQQAPPQGGDAWGGYQGPPQGQGLPPQPPANPFGGQAGPAPF